MLFFMAGVEVAIASMYFVLSTSDSAKVMRSPMYIALLGELDLCYVVWLLRCYSNFNN